MDQVNDLCHRVFSAVRSVPGVCKVDPFPIAQEPPGEKQVIEIFRSRLQIKSVHPRARCSVLGAVCSVLSKDDPFFLVCRAATMLDALELL